MSLQDALPPAANPVPERYHPALVALHWSIALLIFITAYLALGGEAEGRRQAGPTFAGLPVLGIHMILGLTVLVLLTVRLVIRWRTQHPEWASAGNPILDKIGVLTHWGLYFFTFAITITGLVMALQTNRLSRVFNPGTAARTSAPFTSGWSQPGQVPPSSQFRPGQLPRGGSEGRFERGGGFFLRAFHGLSWTILLLLVVLHVGASLYHQFLRRDGLLGRMWFGRRFA